MKYRSLIEKHFHKKVVWITGASSGIGRSLAELCAQAGAHVIISARREHLLTEIKDGLAHAPGTVDVIPLDVTDETGIPGATDTAAAFHGRIDILILAAGISLRSLVKDLEYGVVKRMLETDYLGAVNITLQVLKHMYRSGAGHIVVISSLMGKFGTPLRSAYCAAKHALQGFYEAFAVEGRHDNIDVTLILPGWIRTDMPYRALEGDGAEHAILDEGHAKAPDPLSVAPHILRAIAKKKHECYVAMNPKTWTGLALKRIFPPALRFVLGKIKVT